MEQATPDIDEAHVHAPEGYPDIGSYAVLGDCRTAVLVDRMGRIEWACFPDFSSTAYFGALLDRKVGGAFSLFPVNPRRTHRRYLPGTPVLETEVETDTGTAVITEAMSALNAEDDYITPESEILRRVTVREGTVDVALRLEPRRGYGRAPMTMRGLGRIGWSFADGGRGFILRTDLDVGLTQRGAVLEGVTRLEAGETRHVSLAYVGKDPGVVQPLGAEADARLDATIRWWDEWSGRLQWAGPWREPAFRSALALKLLTHARSGAIVAAPTTSLPETSGGSRNWDYRYCWLRDASLTVRALVTMGCNNEAGAFFDWLLHATRKTHPHLRVLYDVYGQESVPERTLPHLEGWRGSQPVRVGNNAHDQLQLDGYGQIVSAAAEFLAGGGEIGRMQQRRIWEMGRIVSRVWKEPDAGIWEIRGQRRHYTHSKMLCWAALNCLVRLVEDGAFEGDAEPLRKQRTEIANFIEEECYHPERGYVAASDSDAPDASLLTLPKYGYVDANDPRFLRTFETIDRELRVGEALILRYPFGFDRLASEENAFFICSFWAVEALARMGRVEQAERRMEVLLEYGNDLGFFAEEAAAVSGEHLGNYPQAFSHVGLILAAEAISRASQGSPQ
ncbi:glycoside hydrolase family 15 protein [Citreimonas salinaria]|uniref:Glucoamylase (Glucan-1,4-alpha-glucosidase), GH15 family n=1 Tax=Citreimonas salinaria TaxID=321339 RepID=A0A1H3NEM1_9RHOB|nr:glycoside hydrolase family 15 protein [Citreimonas salinaria]SDY87362.1 Glucoamylase (glucan-1,4-alpha-glucosidase), GH15 family [Citreimonas salinaria]